MRAIKFRAKETETGEWIYGYYTTLHVARKNSHDKLLGYDEVPSIFNDEPGNRQKGGYWHNVDPLTVGQFTSLKDKDGREIYEGDILGIDGETDRLEVRFVRGVFAFLWNGNLDDEFPTGSPTHEWAVVVGNIHDNPEMIKR